MFEHFRLLQLIQVIWRAKSMNQCQSLPSIWKGCRSAWRGTSETGV